MTQSVLQAHWMVHQGQQNGCGAKDLQVSFSFQGHFFLEVPRQDLCLSPNWELLRLLPTQVKKVTNPVILILEGRKEKGS